MKLINTTWDCEDKNKINGKLLQITKNLYLFLKLASRRKRDTTKREEYFCSIWLFNGVAKNYLLFSLF